MSRRVLAWRDSRCLLLVAQADCLATEGVFLAAIWADVDILADFYFAGGDFGFGVEAEALAVDYEADVGADFAVGPEIERFIYDQISDAIVAFDEPRHFGGGFRGGDIFFGLRGRREKADARHVLRKHADDGEAERLVNIGDEFVARQIFDG